MAIRLWMRSSISLIDVRYKRIDPDKPLESYRLPGSTVIYAYGGAAHVQLDQTVYQLERFGVLHGGKGTVITIYPADTILQTYMVLYKAETAPFYEREVRRLLNHINPFVQVFGFIPKNPIFFTEKFETMHSCWAHKTSIHQFQSKIVFYQLIHHIYEELHSGGVHFIEPDYAEWVKQYLDTHYADQISIQFLVEMLPISRSMVSKLFKMRENKSLQEYLIERRLEAAKKHLLNSNATIQEVAAGSGFVDELNLIRMFHKYVRMTPSDYRRKMIPRIRNCDIDNDSHRLYNEGGLDRLAKFKGDGELPMPGKTNSKEIMLAAAMSLMLLLSACTTGATVNQAPSSSPASAQSQAQPASRIVKTEMGDVEIPGEPAKIATLVGSFADDVLTLGFTPHAVDAGEGNSFKENMYLKDKLAGAIPLGSTWTPNMEAILQAEPDLIISHKAVHEKAYADLTAIAPTVLFNPDSVTWREELLFIGEVLGNKDLAEQKLAEYDAQAAAAKEALAAKGLTDKTVLFLRVLPKEVRVYGAISPQGKILYTDLGLKPAPNIPLEAHAEPVAMEKLPEINPDILFLMDNTEDNLKAFKEHPLWQNLQAVKDNRVYLAGKDVWPWGGWLAHTQAVEYIVSTLSES